ncbi:MAG TPA: hypothetical protein VF316_09040 [Polyangiaceae bacterium]
MSTSPQVITLELQAIVGALTLAQNALKRVDGQRPPGPPVVPDQTTALNVIVTISGQIQTLATAILATPAGVPGAGP